MEPIKGFDAAIAAARVRHMRRRTGRIWPYLCKLCDETSTVIVRGEDYFVTVDFVRARGNGDWRIPPPNEKSRPLEMGCPDFPKQAATASADHFSADAQHRHLQNQMQAPLT